MAQPINNSHTQGAVDNWLENSKVGWYLVGIFIIFFLPLTVFVFKLSIDVEYGPLKTHRQAQGSRRTKDVPVQKTKKGGRKDTAKSYDEPILH